jgi:hypothetical protein
MPQTNSNSKRGELKRLNFKLTLMMSPLPFSAQTSPPSNAQPPTHSAKTLQQQSVSKGRRFKIKSYLMLCRSAIGTSLSPKSVRVDVGHFEKPNARIWFLSVSGLSRAWHVIRHLERWRAPNQACIANTLADHIKQRFCSLAPTTTMPLGETDFGPKMSGLSSRTSSADKNNAAHEIMGPALIRCEENVVGCACTLHAGRLSTKQETHVDSAGERLSGL